MFFDCFMIKCIWAIEMNIDEINIASLAYLGDSVYELEIRNHLLANSKAKVNNLKNESIKFVSAVSQAGILDRLIENGIISSDELSLVKRARNYRPNSKPRYTDIKLYKKATALEALFGYLYLSNNTNRIKQIIKEIFGD